MNNLWVADVIGKHWKEYETGPDYFDCWGIVCHGFEQKFKTTLDRHLETPTLNPLEFHKVVKSEIKSEKWVKIEQLEDGCLVLMSQSRVWHHVGMWLEINGGRLLHSRDGVGVSLDSRNVLKTFNKTEFWKYVAR